MVLIYRTALCFGTVVRPPGIVKFGELFAVTAKSGGRPGRETSPFAGREGRGRVKDAGQKARATLLWPVLIRFEVEASFAFR